MARDGRSRTTPDQDRQASDLAAAGQSYRQIALALGVSDKTAKQAAERGANLAALSAEAQATTELWMLLGKRWRRLTAPELVAMRSRRAGYTLEAIGRELGVSKQRVAQLQQAAERKLREERK